MLIVKKLQREIIKKVSKLELSILFTVCLFMWVYIMFTVCLFMWVYIISTRYLPNILSSFGVIEQTQTLVKKCKGK